MTTNIVPLTQQNLSKIEFDADDQWVVKVNKEEFTLTGKEADILKKANDAGFRGIVWFKKFAISIAHISSVSKHRDGKKYRDQMYEP